MLAKILAENRLLRVNGKLYELRQNISWEARQRADILKGEVVKQYRFSSSFLRTKNCERILINLGLLAPDYLERSRELHAKLKRLKVELYQQYPDITRQKFTRKQIAAVKSELDELFSSRHCLDAFTLEGYAERRATFFLLRHQLIRGPKNYGFIEKLNLAYNKDCVSIDEIKKIARSDSWLSTWRLKKGAIFKRQPLTDEQIALGSYTRMYENIHQHPEAPPQEIIEDEDMLDGWIILQSKERQKQVSFGSKIDGSKEVFIMAKDDKHAQEIYKMNSEEQRAIQNVRFKQLQSQGQMQFGQFADVAKERVIQNAKR